MAGEAAGLINSISATLPAVSSGADGDVIVGIAPFAGVVTSVTYIPEVAITGANTNSRTVALVNKAQDGTGVVSVASLALVSGVNAAAFDEKAVTLSGTAANLVVAAGDVLEYTSTHVGTGIADPGGRVVVTISRTAGS